MSAIKIEAKTFNNSLGFEWGFWLRQTLWFESVPKRSVFGILVFGSAANLTIYTDSIFAVIILRLAAPNPIANAPSNHLLRRR